MSLELPRRSFLLGLGALMAAPAIVRVSSIIPVVAYDEATTDNSLLRIAIGPQGSYRWTSFPQTPEADFIDLKRKERIIEIMWHNDSNQITVSTIYRKKDGSIYLPPNMWCTVSNLDGSNLRTRYNKYEYPLEYSTL